MSDAVSLPPPSDPTHGDDIACLTNPADRYNRALRIVGFISQATQADGMDLIRRLKFRIDVLHSVVILAGLKMDSVSDTLVVICANHEQAHALFQSLTGYLKQRLPSYLKPHARVKWCPEMRPHYRAEPAPAGPVADIPSARDNYADRYNPCLKLENLSMEAQFPTVREKLADAGFGRNVFKGLCTMYGMRHPIPRTLYIHCANHGAASHIFRLFTEQGPGSLRHVLSAPDIDVSWCPETRPNLAKEDITPPPTTSLKRAAPTVLESERVKVARPTLGTASAPETRAPLVKPDPGKREKTAMEPVVPAASTPTTLVSDASSPFRDPVPPLSPVPQPPALSLPSAPGYLPVLITDTTPVLVELETMFQLRIHAALYSPDQPPLTPLAGLPPPPSGLYSLALGDYVRLRVQARMYEEKQLRAKQ